MKVAYFVRVLGVLLYAGVFVYLIAKPDADSHLAPLNVGGTIDDMALSLTSDAFEHNESIPSRFTCDGDNVSPPLTVQHIPEGTVSLVLIVEDPDVPTQIRPDGLWNHWVIFNIPPKEFTLGVNYLRVVPA